MLRETLSNGLPLKDRLSIKIESDLRYGEVRFDHWLLHAKVNISIIIIIIQLSLSNIYVIKHMFFLFS